MVRIKELRLQSDFTQKQLATKIGVNQTAVGKYERGELEPNIQMLKKIADIFSCSIDYLVGREDDFGVISSTNSEELSLSDSELELLELFRTLSEVRQETILDSLRGMAVMQKKKA